MTSAACTEAGQIGEGTGYGLAGGVAVGLGVVQANGGQSAVDNLCNDLNAGQQDVGTIGQWLANAGVSQDVTGEILALGGPVLSVLECGCSLEQGIDQLASDVGACLCDLVSWVPGVNCNNCTPPPPVQANCALPTTCFAGSSDPACQMNNTLPGCGTGPFNTTICPSNEQDGPGGAFVSTQTGDPNCPTLLYCYCPKPLVPTWTSVPPMPGSFNNPSATGVFTCACPDGTYQTGTAGGIPICLCDYTNQPPKVGDTPQEQCPFNLLGQPCPQSGQIRVANGKCVAPCSGSSEVMTPDGVCCDPNQVSSCGQCCPSGMIPDPANGTCTPLQSTQTQ